MTNTKTDWPSRPLETGTVYGYHYAICMGPMSINGYLRLPGNHPWLRYDGTLEDHPDIEVHGGVTYERGNVIGFDTCHWADRIHPDSEHGKYMNEMFPDGPMVGSGKVWELPDVRDEVEYLARQAKEQS